MTERLNWTELNLPMRRLKKERTTIQRDLEKEKLPWVPFPKVWDPSLSDKWVAVALCRWTFFKTFYLEKNYNRRVIRRVPWTLWTSPDLPNVDILPHLLYFLSVCMCIYIFLYICFPLNHLRVNAITSTVLYTQEISVCLLRTRSFSFVTIIQLSHAGNLAVIRF